MLKIYGISDILKDSEFQNIITNEKISFFYIKRTERLIPWYDIFTYFFYNINNKLYINDTEFKHIIDDFFINKNLINNINHLNLINNINFKKIFVKKAFFIKYTHSNPGHTFCEIMHQIYFYKTNKLDDYDLFITKELYEFNSFLISVILLFFPKNLINIIDENTLVECENIYIFKPKNYKDYNSINFLIDNLKIETNLIKLHNNICLIKTTETQNQNPTKAFSNEYNEFIKSKNFNIIIPENYTVKELFNIIFNADNIIMSWGCCSYLNSIFVNKNSNILILCHNTYNNEYNKLIEDSTRGFPNILESDWFPKECKNKYILYDLPHELDNLTKISLNNEIDKMINNFF